MIKRNILLLGLVVSLLVVVSLPLILRAVVRWQTQEQIYSIQDSPSRPVAIVYGAAVFRGDRLSTVLKDRMDTAIDLFHTGKVNQLLVSGFRQDDGYDEPGAMAAYAIRNGVPGDKIVADDGGSRTFETCYRAKNKFDVTSAILVTQAFHLPRAIFTCNQLDIDSIGVAADKRPYRAESWYNLREVAATVVALFDVIKQNPTAIGITSSFQ